MSKLIIFVAENNEEVFNTAKKLIENSEDNVTSFIYNNIKYNIRHLESDPCQDCGILDPEYYMVTEAVWKEAGFPTNKGIICITCLEKRLGRLLKKSDLKNVAVNKTVLRLWR